MTAGNHRVKGHTIELRCDGGRRRRARRAVEEGKDQPAVGLDSVHRVFLNLTPLRERGVDVINVINALYF